MIRLQDAPVRLRQDFVALIDYSLEPVGPPRFKRVDREGQYPILVRIDPRPRLLDWIIKLTLALVIGAVVGRWLTHHSDTALVIADYLEKLL
jgi:hypothetical protein